MSADYDLRQESRLRHDSISGYSFGDEHLNELIFDAAARRPRSEFIAFCHSNVPDVLSKRALNTPNLQVVTTTEAILGGFRGNWKAPAAAQVDVWENNKFLLGDFRKLAEYLARSSALDVQTLVPASANPASAPVKAH